jgi:hypothetical protein
MFQAYVKVFEQQPKTILCACGRRFINSEGEIVKPVRMVNDREKIFLSQSQYHLHQKQVVYLCLRNGNAIGEPSSLMFRKTAFDRIGGFSPAFRHAADVDFVIRMARLGDVVYFKEAFLLRRLHGNNLTTHNFKSGIVSRERVQLFEKHVATLDFSSEEVRQFKASMVAKAFFDIVRAVRSQNWSLMSLGMEVVRRFAEWAPLLYGQYALEIIGGRNKDAL